MRLQRHERARPHATPRVQLISKIATRQMEREQIDADARTDVERRVWSRRSAFLMDNVDERLCVGA